MHTIRLRKPWLKFWPGVDGEVRVDVPDVPEASAKTPSNAGLVKAVSVAYSRKFNQPTGMEAGVRVWLHLSQWEGRLLTVRLNDRDLMGGEPPWRVDVTDSLRQHNHLEVRLAGDASEAPRLSGEVSLLIDDSGGSAG